MKYPGPRKINMVHIYIYVDIHCPELCFVNLSQANVI